jgi:hypothetical protein
MSHVWIGVDPTQDNDSADYELGVEMVANVDIIISGIRVFGTPGAIDVTGRQARIWDTTTGLVIATASMPTTLLAGWNVYDLTTPLARTAGQRFLASWSTGGKYSYVAGALDSPVTSADGAVTMLANGGATAGNGRISATPGAYPTTATSGLFWSVDVEYEVNAGDNTKPVISSVVLSSPSLLAVDAAVTASDAETMAGASYKFDWGDGTSTTHSASTASHTYSTPGLKAVLVSVTDSGGLADYEAAAINLQPAPVVRTSRDFITTEVIEPWLYQVLSTDAELISLVGDRVSGTLSGELLGTPYVTFLLQDHGDVQGVGGEEIMGDCLYMVKAVDRAGGWDTVNPIVRRIHALLHRPHTNVSLSNGSLTTIRERIIQYPEVQEGVQYRHLGGIYRIQASHDL